MPPTRATADLHRQVLLLAAGRRLWGRMAPGDFDAAWRRVGPALGATTTAAQLAAAEAGVAYVPAVLEETGQPDEPLAEIRPRAFAGQATDGRSLAGLLYGAVAYSRVGVARGLDGGDALRLGRDWLDRALTSAVADAARDATQAAVAVRPKLRWVRVVNPPCCSRCAVLAGKTFGWNASFPRHPGCDCTALPVTVANADSYLTDPTQLAERGLIKDLTRDQRERIADGTNLNRVLNESRDRWRQRLAADRRRARSADRAVSRAQSWGRGGDAPPPGTTIHQLFDKLRADVDRHQVAAAMRAAGIAD